VEKADPLATGTSPSSPAWPISSYEERAAENLRAAETIGREYNDNWRRLAVLLVSAIVYALLTIAASIPKEKY
jgi:hypothetical protein